ncbi:hypothetical protein O1L44_30105 [Streptomyces noursei]|nr:hypothetical protein [Streptomyces noursei]
MPPVRVVGKSSACCCEVTQAGVARVRRVVQMNPSPLVSQYTVPADSRTRSHAWSIAE